MKIHTRNFIGVDQKTIGLDVEFEPPDLILEQSCTDKNCKLGRYKSGSVCQSCDGHGIVPTPLGWHIISFCCRHAKGYRSSVFAKYLEREDAAIKARAQTLQKTGAEAAAQLKGNHITLVTPNDQAEPLPPDSERGRH